MSATLRVAEGAPQRGRPKDYRVQLKRNVQRILETQAQCTEYLSSQLSDFEKERQASPEHAVERVAAAKDIAIGLARSLEVNIKLLAADDRDASADEAVASEEELLR